MAVYVIVILAVAILLLLAYRSLGGATAAPTRPSLLLATCLAQLRSSIDLLGTVLDARGERLGGGSDAARAGRRATAAAQHALDRLPSAAELDDGAATGRSLLGVAVEDVTWAWRLVEADTSGPALVAAAASLRDHAVECCVAAAGLLRAPDDAPLAEPVDGGRQAGLE